jgi:hypothetical protein
VFHEDIGCAIYGAEASSLEDAQRDAQGWVDQWVKG